jgi:hypothetical protein
MNNDEEGWRHYPVSPSTLKPEPDLLTTTRTLIQ